MKKLIVILLAVAAAAFPSQAAAQESNERIAFDLCGIDFTGEIFLCQVYLVSPDGSKGAFVGDGKDPAWSPDGSRVFFTGYDPQQWTSTGLFVLNLGDWSIASFPNGGDPARSPDGLKLAFSKDGELYVMNADGSNVVQLTNNVGYRGLPAWSRDSGTIAFDCQVESGRDMCAINANGTGFRRLTFDPALDSGANYSADGVTITFVTARYGGYQVAVMSLDGSGVSPVADGVLGIVRTSSPDGTRVVFVVPFVGGCDANRTCPDSIYVMNRDGTDARLIAYGDNPTWALSVRPVALFVSQGCNGLDCAFDGSGSWGGNGLLRYTWGFGDGTPPVTEFGPTLTHTYAGSGRYRVTLTVKDNADVTGTQSQDLDVANNLWPTARFTYACNGSQCNFDGATSSDPDGSIATYYWNFGDGGDATGLTATHIYSAAGPVTVTLTVFDNGGARGSQQQVVNFVANKPPVASFTKACTALTCTFNGSSSSDPDGSIAAYFWNFGDGESATGPTTTHTYSAAGTFTVTLTVTDNGGVTGSQQQAVTVVVNNPPVASFTPPSCAVLIPCTFDGSSSKDPDGSIVSYEWNFGDGTPRGVTAKTSHTYAAAVSYTVSLTVTDNAGGSGFQDGNVTVSPTMHIGDLDRASTNQQSTWTALVTITVHDRNHGPVADATVSGSWSIGGTGSCSTDAWGQCLVSRSTIARKTQSVMFTIVNVTNPMFLYRSVDNHDPDGDSNGTSVTVSNR